MRAGKEITHGLGEVSQRLLLHHLAPGAQPQMLSPSRGELPTLIQVTWRTAAAWTPPRMLLDSEVPYEPGLSAVLP
jgi:hypothetical protein